MSENKIGKKQTVYISGSPNGYITGRIDLKFQPKSFILRQVVMTQGAVAADLYSIECKQLTRDPLCCIYVANGGQTSLVLNNKFTIDAPFSNNSDYTFVIKYSTGALATNPSYLGLILEFSE